jgi:archaellin
MKKHFKKAMMGVGMLLLFIATILSSAIAAGVLITSTGLIQDKALKVDTITRERLVSGLEIFSVYAGGNMTTQTVNNYEIYARLRAGSNPVQLSTLGFSFVAGEQSYNAILNISNVGTNCTFTSLTPETEFCAEKKFGDLDTTILEEGDMAILRYKLSDANSLTTEKSFVVYLQPRTGSLVVLELKTPELVLASKISLR